MSRKLHLYKPVTGGFDPHLCISFCGQAQILKVRQAPVDEMIKIFRNRTPEEESCKACYRVIHQLGKAKK